jgi:hypothetical protein
MSVADHIRDGYSCSEALQIVLGGIRDGSGPRTTDVLLDLEDMGVGLQTRPKPRRRASRRCSRKWPKPLLWIHDGAVDRRILS